MSDPYYIGGMQYGPEEAIQLRREMIQFRNLHLDPNNFDPTNAVILSHLVGLLAALIVDKWPEAKRLMEESER